MPETYEYMYYSSIILLLLTLFLFSCVCQLPLSNFELKYPNKYYLVNYFSKKALMPYENNTLVTLLDYTSANKQQKWKFIPINDQNEESVKYFYIFNSGLNMYLTLDENNNVILNSTYTIANDRAEIIWNINEIKINDKMDLASVLNCNIRNIDTNIIKEYGILELNKDNVVILNKNNQITTDTQLWQIYAD